MESKFNIDMNGNTANIELIGKLDATNAPTLADELKKMQQNPPEKMVFYAKDLEFISSAGLRVMIFAKQKIGENLEVFLIAPQEQVMEVIEMSGLTNFMVVQETYEG